MSFYGFRLWHEQDHVVRTNVYLTTKENFTFFLLPQEKFPFSICCSSWVTGWLIFIFSPQLRTKSRVGILIGIVSSSHLAADGIILPIGLLNKSHKMFLIFPCPFLNNWVCCCWGFFFFICFFPFIYISFFPYIFVIYHLWNVYLLYNEEKKLYLHVWKWFEPPVGFVYCDSPYLIGDDFT